MELGKQIKRYRSDAHYSQEQLAEKLFVSRQTISNWENDKSYPDIQSLLLLSAIFNTSLDALVKEDLSTMKKTLDNNKIDQQMNHYVKIMLISLTLAAISLGPIMFVHSRWIFLVPLVLFLPGLYSSNRIEILKRSAKLKTFSDIVAFSEGRPVEQQPKTDRLSNFLSMVGVVTIFILVFLFICLLSIAVALLFGAK